MASSTPGPDFTPPSPLTWTLRLKSQKTTILLHIDPLQSFSSIKQQLLVILRETTLHHAESHAPLQPPAAAEDIQFGRPVSMNDPSLGFKLGEWEEYRGVAADGGLDEDSKGKGKAKEKNAAVDKARKCPKGAGLRDGAVLAFRWAGDGTGLEEDEEKDWEEDDHVADLANGNKEDGMWGVRLASFEDEYGVENGMDVGGGKEFEG